MSVNLHLSIKITGYDPRRAEAIQHAIQALIERESLENDLSPLAETPEDQPRALWTRSNPDFPVSISSSHTWLPAFQQSLSLAADGANGGPCLAELQVGYPDEEIADEEDEDEDDEE